MVYLDPFLHVCPAVSSFDFGTSYLILNGARLLGVVPNEDGNTFFFTKKAFQRYLAHFLRLGGRVKFHGSLYRRPILYLSHFVLWSG